MKLGTKIVATLICSLLWTNLFAQDPILLNYPLVKGDYKSAQKDNDTLFCMTDYGLMIWDVSNLSNPALISKIPAPGIHYYGRVKLYNNYAILQRNDTIIVIDKSDINNPTYVSSSFNLPFNNYSDIGVKDSLLYVATNNQNSLYVFNIADINNPIQLTSLPITGTSTIDIAGSNLFTYNTNTFYKIDISNPIPVIVDSIVFSSNYSILNAQGNTNAAVIGLGDALNFNQIINNRVYDISNVGNPVLKDTTVVSISSFNNVLELTDSLLFVHNDSIYAYDLSDLNNITLIDTIGFNTNPYELLVDDSLLFIMDSHWGFDIYHHGGSGGYKLTKNHKVGACFNDLQVSSNGFVFVGSEDSVYIFDDGQPTSEIFADYNFISQGEDYLVQDSFLVETYVDNSTSVRLSSLFNLPNIDSFAVLPAHPTSAVLYSKVRGNKFFTYHSLQTEIYDITVPTNPSLLANNIPLWYNYQYGNMLYRFPNDQLIELYDITQMPPLLLKSQALVPPPSSFGFWQIWDSQEPVVHCLNTSNGDFFQLNMRDTSNIDYTQPKSMLVSSSGAEVQMAKVMDSILYLPTYSGNSLNIYDVCDEQYYRLITQFESGKFISGVALIGKTLYLAFGGYVASYDVSGIVPCLIASIDSKDNSNEQIKIYPNPTKDKFTLEGIKGNFSVQVFNLMGQLVLSSQKFDKRTQEIDISNLSKGIYVVRVEFDEGVSNVKIVKE